MRLSKKNSAYIRTYRAWNTWSLLIASKRQRDDPRGCAELAAGGRRSTSGMRAATERRNGNSRNQGMDWPPIFTHNQSSEIGERRMHHVGAHGLEQVYQPVSAQSAD
jgi:hypothetical protein